MRFLLGFCVLTASQLRKEMIHVIVKTCLLFLEIFMCISTLLLFTSALTYVFISSYIVLFTHRYVDVVAFLSV